MSVTPENIAELVAELELLELFDRGRELAGHDYGAGQRAKELSRRHLELEPFRHSVAAPSAAELLAAFERIGRPRVERIQAEAEARRRYPGRELGEGEERTLKAWNRLEKRLKGAADLEAERASAAASEAPEPLES